MQKQLLYVHDLKAALAEIADVGGRVAHQFTPHVIVAFIPEGVSAPSLEHAMVEMPEDLDRASALAVRAWRAIPDLPPPPELDPNQSWGTGGWELPRTPGNDPALRSHMKAVTGVEAITPPATSQLMTGKVAVGAIIVSGETPALTITDAEEITLTAQLMQAMEIFVDAEPQSHLNFVYDIRLLTVDSTPCSNPSTDTYEQCEAPVRDPALAQMGYPAGYNGVQQYINSLVSFEKSDWGFAGFLTKYPLHHFAYAYSGNWFINIGNDNYPPGTLYRTIAHETAHIFGADDEYVTETSSCGCAPSGTWGVFPNANCEACTSTPEPCLMRTPTDRLCKWTRGQLGWAVISGNFTIDSVSDINPKCDDRQALCAYEGTLWMIYKGANSDNLYYATYDGSWSGNKRIEETYDIDPDSNYTPTVAVFYTSEGGDGNMYMVYKGKSSNTIYYAYYDGSEWRGNKEVSVGSASNYSPGLAAYDGKLWMIYKGAHSDELYWATYDGESWDGNEKIKDTWEGFEPESDYSVSLITYRGKLWMIYKGEGSDHLYWATYDGSDWEGNEKIADTDGSYISPESNYAPGLVVYNDILYLFYKGAHSNDLYWALYNGAQWTGNKPIKDTSSIDPASNYPPTAAFYDDLVRITYKGAHSDDIYIAYYYESIPDTDTLVANGAPTSALENVAGQ